MKKCPFCAEEIQDQAIKCRFCGEFLNKPIPSAQKQSHLPWYFSTNIIVLAFMIVGPFALPLVIFHPKYKPATKIIITVAVVALTVGIYIFTQRLLNELTLQLRQIGY